MLSACVSLRCAGVCAVSVLRLYLQVPVLLYSDPLLLEWRGSVLTHKKTANYSGPAVSQVRAGSRGGAPTFSNSHLHAWNCIKTSGNTHQSQPPSHQKALVRCFSLRLRSILSPDWTSGRAVMGLGRRINSHDQPYAGEIVHKAAFGLIPRLRARSLPVLTWVN